MELEDIYYLCTTTEEESHILLQPVAEERFRLLYICRPYGGWDDRTGLKAVEIDGTR